MDRSIAGGGFLLRDPAPVPSPVPSPVPTPVPVPVPTPVSTGQVGATIQKRPGLAAHARVTGKAPRYYSESS